MQTQNRIYEGMLVRDAEGVALGKVVALGRERFLIEKGRFFPRDYAAPYSAVRDVQGTEIRLASTRESLARGVTAAHADYPWPQDGEEEETLPGAPLEQRPPGLERDEDEEDEITQKIHRSRVSDRADTEDVQTTPYQAAAVSTDEPVDGPDIDVGRRF